MSYSRSHANGGQSLGMGRLTEGGRLVGIRTSANGAVGRWVGGWVTPR